MQKLNSINNLERETEEKNKMKIKNVQIPISYKNLAIYLHLPKGAHCIEAEVGTALFELFLPPFHELKRIQSRATATVGTGRGDAPPRRCSAPPLPLQPPCKLPSFDTGIVCCVLPPPPSAHSWTCKTELFCQTYGEAADVQ